jgi:hypothetical protein
VLSERGPDQLQPLVARALSEGAPLNERVLDALGGELIRRNTVRSTTHALHALRLVEG